jgi:hypothetical protein
VVHNVHGFIMGQHAQRMWGMACERTLGIPTANLGSTGAGGSRSALWKDGFAEAPSQGGLAVSIGEPQWKCWGHGLQPSRRRSTGHAAQPGQLLRAELEGLVVVPEVFVVGFLGPMLSVGIFGLD